MSNIEPAYTAICTRAAELQLPKAYHDDLNIHDRNAVSKYGSATRLLWAAREYGTHLFPLDAKHWMSHEEMCKWVLATISVFGDCQWHHWDGTTLHAVSADTVKDMLDDMCP